MKINASLNTRGWTMKRLVCAGMLALVAVVSIVAQSPKGWLVRIDRSTSATDPDGSGSVKLVTTATGFHATTPQAAVFWTGTDTATGTYTLKGTFTLLRLSDHPNYYGLVFGGRDLGSSGQSYLYFMVAQDGTWLLKRRDASATGDLAGRTINAAVKKPDASGRSVNALEVRVLADRVDYVVNGVVVHTTPKTGATAKTDGLYAFRSNHLLDINVDGFGIAK
jgi:hypothetical protein